MTLLDERKKSGFPYVILIIAALLIFLTFRFPSFLLKWNHSNVTQRESPPSYVIKEVMVSNNPEDLETDEGLHGKIVEHIFHQDANTSGKSADELSLSFNQDILIYGISLGENPEIDHHLVEFIAGINQKPAYNALTDNDILFQGTFAGNIFYPLPFILKSTDKINVGARIQNNTSITSDISAKIIIYYKWVPQKEKDNTRKNMKYFPAN